MSLANGDSQAFFSAAEQGKLLFQQCNACGQIQFPPRHHCAHCWKEELDWVQSKGTGHIESFTIVRRAPLATFAEKVPYVIASVIVDEGPRMITSLCGDDALDVAIGDPVSVVFESGQSGDTLPMFQRTPSM